MHDVMMAEATAPVALLEPEDDAPAMSGTRRRPSMLHKVTSGQPSGIALAVAMVLGAGGTVTGAGALMGGEDKEIEQLRRDIDANSTALVAAEDSLSAAEKAMLRDAVSTQRWTMDQLIKLSVGMGKLARALDLELDVRVDAKLPEIQ